MKIKVKTSNVAIVILTVLFGGIALTSALGWWKTTSSKQPVRYSQGEYTGEYNPADIRGSYSFGEISELFQIPLEDLGKAFGVKDESSIATFKCKDLETLYSVSAAEGKEVGTDSVRIFVALYKSLPIPLTETTYLLKPAVGILQNQASLTDAQKTWLDTHTVTPVPARY